MRILVVFLRKTQKLSKNHYVSHQNRKKRSTFDENPCRFLRKTQKSEKSITFSRERGQNERFCFILLSFFAFWPCGTLFPSRQPN